MQKILDALNKIKEKGHSSDQVFQDWIDIILYSFLKQSNEFNDMVDKYPNKLYVQGQQPKDYFFNAFAELLIAMTETDQDILGDIYMKFCGDRNSTKRVFTPHHIVRLMASRLNVGNAQICDPDCGSGRMIIEISKQMTMKKRIKTWFWALDNDLILVKISVMNMWLFKLNSFVLHCDTLTKEVKTGYKTEYTPWGGVISRLSESEVEALQKQIQSCKKAIPNCKLSMFDG